MMHPYYIIAPDYRHNSSGIHVIHLLCHLINQAGGRAYLVGCQVCCPGLNTPLLTQDIFNLNRASQLNPVAVYPEVVKGNPLNANAVVRYLLNREGVINGNSMDAEITDSFFYYRQGFADAEKNADILRVPVIDLALFCDEKMEREHDLLYINRVPDDRIDLTQFPEKTLILDAKNPLNLPELAQLLKRARRLYTYEASSTCTLATLCGCPVIALSLPGFEHLAINAETVRDVGDAGIVWHDSPTELAECRKNIDKVAQFYRGIEAQFQTQLEHFLHTTQEKADRLNHGAAKNQVELYLDRMKMVLPTQFTADEKGPALTTYVFVPANKVSAFAECMQFIIDNQPALSANKFIFIVDKEKLSPELQQRCLDCELTAFCQPDAPVATSWFNFISVEDRFILAGLPTLHTELERSQTLAVVYCDILLQAKEGSVLNDGFLPEFDERLFFSHPHIYLRSLFFNAEQLCAGDFSIAEDLITTILINLLPCLQSGHKKTVKHISLPLVAVDKNIETDVERIKSLLKDHFKTDIRYNALIGYSCFCSQKPPALVSLFITYESDLNHFQNYITNLLKSISYSPVEIMVALSGDLSADELAFFEQLAQVDPEAIKVFYHQSKLSPENLLAKQVAKLQGEFIIYIEPWITPLVSNWIELLLDYALQPAVGGVFGKIIDEQQNIVSAGALASFDDPVRQPFYGLRYDSPGYLNRLQAVQQYHRCLSDLFILRKSLLADWTTETCFHHRSEFFCSITHSIKKQQCEIIFTPFVVSLCNRTKAPAITAEPATATVENDMASDVEVDLAYNCNLSLDAVPFTFLNDNFIHEGVQPKAILFSSYESQRHVPQRLVQPFHALTQQQFMQGLVLAQDCGVRTIERLNPEFIVCSAFDVSHFTHRLSDHRWEKIVDFDMSDLDFLHDKNDLKARLIVAANKAGRLTSSSQYLLNNLLNKYDAVYQPDYLDISWAITAIAPPAEKLRIAIFTANRTLEDISLITNIVKEFCLAAEWICIGPVPPKINGYITESYRGFEPASYNSFISALNLHLALLPRSDNLWNRMRGGREWMELAACGISLLCSDIPTEAAELPLMRIKNKSAAWRNALADCLKNPVKVIENGVVKKSRVNQSYIIKPDHHPFIATWCKASL